MIKKTQLSTKPCSNYLIKTFYENGVALKKYERDKAFIYF